MQEIFKLLIGAGVLILAFPIGTLLARKTKEELKEGRKWFKIIIYIGMIGGVSGLLIGNDVLMFSFFFIALVTSRSLKNGKNRKKIQRKTKS